jgi:hypothetical protein
MRPSIDINDEADKFLTDAQLKEILRRQIAFENGGTPARSWEEILIELEHVYSK